MNDSHLTFMWKKIKEKLPGARLQDAPQLSAGKKSSTTTDALLARIIIVSSVGVTIIMECLVQNIE